MTATAPQLESFGRMFVCVLRNTHPQIRIGKHYNLGSAICFSFVFGRDPTAVFGDPAQLEHHLEDLLRKQKSPSLRIQRVVRIFDGNCLFFVKPVAFRFWTKSIAVRDADEVFANLTDQGM